jgi:eukaryotic-like serine/threonine-protein kinase
MLKSTGEHAVARTDPSPPLSNHDWTSAHLTFEPGAKVGRYRLLAPIACGGMAQVWAARPEVSGFARTIALKLIRHEYATDPEYVRMFLDEATVAAAVQHPNVCETYELGCEDGVLFLALEWVAGDSLAGVLHRSDGMAPLSYCMAARVIADACAGLHAAHEATDIDGNPLNVVHRDVSPPNILLSLHGHVKMSDFGIAKARYQLHSKTKTGEIKGKFSYIAPEQIGGQQVDRRADVFAMGCVLYVATLALRPFGSGPRAMGKILTGIYKKPSSLVENYPPELEAVIDKCLQRYPEQRYATADEMRLDLERWLLKSGDIVSPKDIAQLVKARIDPERRRVTEAILRSNQVLTDAAAVQVVCVEEAQTPTATSSVLFGPSSNDRAPSPLAARKKDTRPSVRFLPFAKPTTESSQAPDDTSLVDGDCLLKETWRPAAKDSAPSSEVLDGATLLDAMASPPSQPTGNSRAASNPAVLSHLPPRVSRLKRPYTWLAIGVFIATGLILALGWSSRRVSSIDATPQSGDVR